MEEDDASKNYTLLRIRKIEEDLKTEYYKIVNDD
jgi:hypothetical protein